MTDLAARILAEAHDGDLVAATWRVARAQLRADWAAQLPNVEVRDRFLAIIAAAKQLLAQRQPAT